LYVSISLALLWDCTTGARMTIKSSTNIIFMTLTLNRLCLSLKSQCFSLSTWWGDMVCEAFFMILPTTRKFYFFLLFPRFLFFFYATTFLWFFLKHEYLTIMANT
jgi:hypothetical protein